MPRRSNPDRRRRHPLPRWGHKVLAAAFPFDRDQRAALLVHFANTFACLGILVGLPGLGERKLWLPLALPPLASWPVAPRRTKVELATSSWW
jgi:hypothetical protein